jgi:phosphate:Na+ symporter
VPGSRLLALLVLLTATAAPAGGVDWWAFGLRVLAGLVLFLFGVDLLARALRDAAGDRFRALLARTASNRFAGLGMGTAATVVLDSSSVTIIMLIALVDAQLLRSADALAMVLGSNIGTTFSSQVFAWNVDAVAPVMMAGGFLARVLARSDGARRWGDAALGLGLVLFGLSLIEGAAAPLERHPEVVGLLRRLDQPLIGALAGAAVTAAIQSSSATIGIVIALAGAGLIDLPAGVAIMLGAEIGTCADTLVATLGRSRAAVRIGLFTSGSTSSRSRSGFFWWTASPRSGGPRRAMSASRSPTPMSCSTSRARCCSCPWSAWRTAGCACFCPIALGTLRRPRPSPDPAGLKARRRSAICGCGSRAGVVVANLVRAGRQQPQRFRHGSFRLPPRSAGARSQAARASRKRGRQHEALIDVTGFTPVTSPRRA